MCVLDEIELRFYDVGRHHTATAADDGIAFVGRAQKQVEGGKPVGKV